MNSLSGIRAINNGNKPTPAVRWQRQYKGTQWAAFDSHTGTFAPGFDDVIDADMDVDLRNLNHEAAKAVAFGTARLPSSNVVAQAQDLNESLRKEA